MLKLMFEKDNNNEYTINHQHEISLCYHINTAPFAINHGHEDYWEFTILTDGSIINEINGVDNKYTNKTLFYSTTDDIHKLKGVKKNEKLRYINIIVREQKVCELASAISSDFLDKLKTGNRDFELTDDMIFQIEKIIHKINLLGKNHINEYNDLLCSALLLILQFIFLKSISEKSNTDTWVDVLNTKMENPEFISMNVNELSKTMNVSRMQFDRLIQKYYNKSPHEFLIGYKLRYAKNLLISTDMRIEDICKKVGYSSFSSFFKNFKEKYKITPNQIRKNRV